MKYKIANELRVIDPTPEFRSWVIQNYRLENPAYQKKIRMKLWIGNTPKHLDLFRADGGGVVLPYGTINRFLNRFPDSECVGVHFKRKEHIEYSLKLDLLDYQEPAVAACVAAKHGILQAPAGSGKTMMGLALAARIGGRTLWLTHTQDLLKQSEERARSVYKREDAFFGRITEGKVSLGSGITFATVQTMANLDLNTYRDLFDTVIVDECHRVCGTETSCNRFKVILSALAARHKYGLSATVHRADGLIGCAFALLGDICYTVSAAVVSDRVITPQIIARTTEFLPPKECLDTDGTIIFAKLITEICKDEKRNEQIVGDLMQNCKHYNLILSDRVEHLYTLRNALPITWHKYTEVIDSKHSQTKAGKLERENAIERMRKRESHFLFATYALAKEGLDIPCLDRLYLVTPQKDYAVITQAVGRIQRKAENKETPVCYDYVDSMLGSLFRMFRNRKTHYKKLKCEILEE